MPMGNAVKQVRPNSTFENFEKLNKELESLAEKLQKLVDSIIAKGEQVLVSRYPFADAKLIILWGKPGRGKTHLVEAFINAIAKRDPRLLSRIYLSRYNFTYENIAGVHSYDDLPIIVIDDIFANHQSIDELHPATDIASFMAFVQMIYEDRRLVIMTGNFPFRNGILEKVRAVDKTGRVLSRMQELMASAGEIEVVGDDYREKLAREKAGQEFSV